MPCHAAVLTSLQFWGALVIPTVLITDGQLRAYLAWRQRQREQRRRRQAGSRGDGDLFPLQPAQAQDDSKSSSGGERGSSKSGSSLSSRHSPSRSASTDSLDELEGIFANSEGLAQVLRRCSRRSTTAHPEDWQYEMAGRIALELRPTWRHLALLAFAMLHLYSWHLMLFPFE